MKNLWIVLWILWVALGVAIYSHMLGGEPDVYRVVKAGFYWAILIPLILYLFYFSACEADKKRKRDREEKVVVFRMLARAYGTERRS